MSRALALVPDLPDLQLDPRLTVVTAALQSSWRPGEWDAERLMLTLDTRGAQAALSTCRVAGCTKTARSRHGLCPVCRKEWKASGRADLDQWLSTAVRGKPLRGETELRERRCSVGSNGIQCGRLIVSRPRGLCNSHDTSLRAATARGVTEEQWRTTARPLRSLPACRAPFCTTQGYNRALCKVHYTRWVAASKPSDIEAWCADQEPVQNAAELWLGGMSPLAFAEMLYVLQIRDSRGIRLDTTPPRVLARAVREQQCQSILDVNGPFRGATHSFERVARDALTLLYANPNNARASDVWDLRAFGLHAGRESGTRPLMVDFGPIRQRWLRDLAKDWIQTGSVNRSDNVRDAIRGIALLSDAIALGPGHDDPGKLDHADIERFLTRLKQDPTGHERRSRLLGAVRFFVRHGRADGWFDDTPGRFDFRPSDVLPQPASDDDELVGRALPEHVIRQLDAQLELLDRAWARGPLAPILNELRRLCYMLLRDTGRRISDLAALPLDCVADVPGGFELVYTNVKARRRGRRLPIESHTAREIRRIADLVAAAYPATPRARLPLFPAPMSNPDGHRRIRPDSLGTWIDAWLDEVVVYDDHVDSGGNAAPFPRERMFPHAFRHAYAQRHADAGVAPDVLRELMDHKSLSTTMGYYTVSAKRRREAVEAVAAMRIDRDGNRVGLISPTTYGRQSVAVPYGNCEEPSNVAAGGKACPIRFQCAGCGSYRPDPSFLPAIDTHISELLRNREEAMASGTAQWVIDGIEAEIAAYRQIAAKMRTDLAELPPDERQAIGDASAILRKMRSSAACKPQEQPVFQIGRRPPEGGHARY